MRNLGIVMLLVAACSGESGSMEVVTFNAGLAPGDVPYVDERASHIAATLAESPPDILCVQEYWRDADFAALATALQGELPYTVRLPAEPTPVTCSYEELAPLAACGATACPGLCGGALASCALDACAEHFATVTDNCGACLTGRIAVGDCLDDVRNNCLGSGSEGPAYIYGGAFDTGLFLRWAPLESDSFVLDSYLVRSAVHHARVDTPVGLVDVFCAHLSSPIPPFVYHGDFGSWDGEHAHQVQQLIERVAATTGAGKIIVLGDLNMGPAVGSMVAELPEDYATLLASGLRNPFVDAGAPWCTACADNLLRGPGGSDKLIDHVLVSGFEPVPLVGRYMTERVGMELGGERTPMNYSDHYGLSAAFSED